MQPASPASACEIELPGSGGTTSVHEDVVVNGSRWVRLVTTEDSSTASGNPAFYWWSDNSAGGALLNVYGTSTVELVGGPPDGSARRTP